MPCTLALCKIKLKDLARKYKLKDLHKIKQSKEINFNWLKYFSTHHFIIDILFSLRYHNLLFRYVDFSSSPTNPLPSLLHSFGSHPTKKILVEEKQSTKLKIEWFRWSNYEENSYYHLPNIETASMYGGESQIIFGYGAMSCFPLLYKWVLYSCLLPRVKGIRRRWPWFTTPPPHTKPPPNLFFGERKYILLCMFWFL